MFTGRESTAIGDSVKYLQVDISGKKKRYIEFCAFLLDFPDTTEHPFQVRPLLLFD